MRLAHIEDGNVVNVIYVDPKNIPEWAAAYPAAPDGIGPGATYANGVFTPIPDPSPEEELAMLAEAVRASRDAKLTDLDAIVSNPLRWAELTSAQQDALAAYRQDLLDVPQQDGFPENVIWPTKPEV